MGMNKLKAVIQYECITSFRYIWIFYAIMYAVVGLITVIIGISMGSWEDVGTNALEVNTLIYLGILGVVGFSDDFKTLIQNGFTRKYIFIATVTMFAFIAGVMALVDTVMGNLIHHFMTGYSSMYAGIYGYGNMIVNWIWLFLVYMTVCTLLYLVILVMNRMGKHGFIYLGIGVVAVVVIIAALFRYVMPVEMVNDILELVLKALGFMADGSKNLLFPILTFFCLSGILGLGSYAVIRRTEIH